MGHVAMSTNLTTFRTAASERLLTKPCSPSVQRPELNIDIFVTNETAFDRLQSLMDTEAHLNDLYPGCKWSMYAEYRVSS